MRTYSLEAAGSVLAALFGLFLVSLLLTFVFAYDSPLEMYADVASRLYDLAKSRL